jgi:hypothetical protein
MWSVRGAKRHVGGLLGKSPSIGETVGSDSKSELNLGDVGRSAEVWGSNSLYIGTFGLRATDTDPVLTATDPRHELGDSPRT